MSTRQLLGYSEVAFGAVWAWMGDRGGKTLLAHTNLIVPHRPPPVRQRETSEFN